MNSEGYPDRTAEIAIGRVAKEQKMAAKRKGGKKDHGSRNADSSKAQKSNKN